ncbi:transcriptional regulator, IclR family [Devosia enhydra]|uniref:Transcriptional regulator, IclR family n=1 Tax=Devosia enhydra TaxID=665118 RepID=A0A1K2I2Y4_9HYPH|nr:IclR family transcriptional regulator [Devosia enhydra]SFZ86599.1 transcriptional regulator, IclR family [Devosia enhydra]
MNSAPRIQSLARADAILGRVMAAGREGVRLAELSAAVKLNKTTVFNLVGTLVSLGYVTQDKDSRAYRLGPRSLMLGLSAQRQNSLLDVSRDALERLCRDTRETVNLAVPMGDTAIIVDSREGGHQIRLTSYSGTLAPYHATAVGKAILAFLDPARAALALEAPMTPIGPRTITDRATLLAELDRIRQTRRSLDLEEMEQGAHCVAVPIFDPLGAVCAAISVSGLRDRLGEAELAKVADMIAVEIAGIEKRLGMAG